MLNTIAIRSPHIFDGETWHEDAVLVVENGLVKTILPSHKCSLPYETLPNGMLMPGLIDLQVNGGGGVLLNADPSEATIATMVAAHRSTGTTRILPTLITDSLDVAKQAIDAVVNYRVRQTGVLGLHLEGPHLSRERCGVHQADYVRSLSQADLDLYLNAIDQLGCVFMTVAPESVSSADIMQLVKHGIIVSLGHSNTSYEQAMEAFVAGASGVTHLWNAMSPLQSREPGLVGAVLNSTHGMWCGVIVDGVHVSPVTLQLSYRAKHPSVRWVLVSDAMPTVGTSLTQFELQGRTVFRERGALRLADGTLSGSDISLFDAVSTMYRLMPELGVGEIWRMASLYVAQWLQKSNYGHLRPGAVADMVWVDSDVSTVNKVWVDGQAGVV